MRPAAFLLKILLFTAAFAVIVYHPRQVAGLSGQRCIKYIQHQGTCPTTCTSSNYLDTQPNGPGMYSLTQVTKPCGDSKPGLTCTQPTAWTAYYDQSCCVNLGDYCANGAYQCCVGQGTCNGTFCCQTQQGEPCQRDTDCCPEQNLICNPLSHWCQVRH